MPEVRAIPRTPEQLLEELFAIFPQYRASYTGSIHGETPTWHSVLIGFSCFRLASSSEIQLRAFGELVSAAVAGGGPLANAFETCLLEHLHQIGAERALRPYLSKTAREKTRAYRSIERRTPLGVKFRTMTCEHLRALEQAVIGRGIRETFRGPAWSKNFREWVYFDCYLDIPAIRSRFAFSDCVEDHVHRGTHDGQERGLVCSTCHDGIMGRYEPSRDLPEFRG